MVVKKVVAVPTLAFLILLGALAQPIQNLRAAIVGRWQVVQVICPTCDSEAGHDKGAVIAFNNTSITNPFGGDCAQLPGYDLLRTFSTERLLKTKGKSWPKEIIEQLKSNDSLLYGYVTCGGMNHMRMIFGAKERAYYFWEGDRIFVLARSKP